MTLKEIIARLQVPQHPFMLKGKEFVVAVDQKNTIFTFECISVGFIAGRTFLFFAPVVLFCDRVASAVVWNLNEDTDEMGKPLGYWSLPLHDHKFYLGEKCDYVNVELFETWLDRQSSQTITL